MLENENKMNENTTEEPAAETGGQVNDLFEEAAKEPVHFDEPETVQDPFREQEPVQPQPEAASGSYYSPRSGVGYIPPTGGNVPPQNADPEKPAKRSHKGLRALAVFAGIAFLSYASIQCYIFATQNETARKFLGKNNASESRLALSDSSDGSKETNTEESSAAQTEASETSESTDSSAVTAQHWIDLAARKDSMTIPDIVDKVTPATVGIASTFVYQGQSYSMFGFGFGGFGGDYGGQTYEEEMAATGTGIIMSKDGYIITNAHVIYDNDSQYHMGEAREVKVVLNEDYYSGETNLDAEIIEYDVEEDIAVLKVNTTQDLTVAEFGDSNDLRVGELVIAIGNPLGFELFGSVTTGIVSALDREVTINDKPMRLIQTDTAINSGNSGGPLINSYGQVIGINSSKMSSNYYSDSASIEGLCFAIPISHAREVINDLLNVGYVTGKPLLGLSGKPVPEEIAQAYGMPVGVYVQKLSEGGAAQLAGMQVGDIIIAVNGKTITTYEELNAEKDKHKAGDTITVTVSRQGEDIDLSVTLQEKKPENS